MPLQQHHIDELKAIHKSDFGEELSDKEAWEMGTRLVELFRLLLKNAPNEGESEPSPQPPTASQPGQSQNGQLRLF